MSETYKEEKNLQNYKVVLMGDKAVGKTSIVDRYTKDKFDSNKLSSTRIGFTSKILNFDDIQKRCKLDVNKLNNFNI
jgi:GTPase SAR1 family protein